MPGFKVLLVGGKGGYINSLVAQIVGIRGEVVTVSSSQHILDTCKKRVSDSLLCNMMRWIKVSNCSKDSDVLGAIDDNTKFDAIIYCGFVAKLPSLESLIEERGSLIAPVQVSSTSQQLQMLTIESQTKKEIRKISEFGVSFESPK
jgi:protein-L-isoaspartate O-methyltransferase